MTDNASKADPGRDLMLQVARDDERAFESLVSLYQKSVINTVYRFLGDATLAEDLAQEVFLKIYKARKSYQPLARFETWLHRIVYNVVINAAQSRKRRQAYSLEALQEMGWQEGKGQVQESIDPVAQLERRELQLKVRQTVLELPEQQRMALILNKYQGLSYHEIARALQMSMEAVKSLLYRAREKVRDNLKGYLRSEVPDEM